MPTQDEQSPNQYQTTQPATGERPAESAPIRENWQTLAKLLQGDTIEDGHRHDFRTLPILEGWGLRNIARNGSFEKANGSGSALFDSWQAVGMSVAIAATSVAGEFTHRTQAAKLTNGASNSATFRHNTSESHEPLTSLLGWLQGKTVVFTAKVRTDTASRVRLNIFDDDGTNQENANSSQHSGGDTFETLTVAKTVQPDATTLRFQLVISTGTQIDAIIDEARIYVIGVDDNAADPNTDPPSLEYHEWDFLPAPVDDNDPATKKYVDDAGGGGGTEEIVLNPITNTADFGGISKTGSLATSAGFANWFGRAVLYDDSTTEGNEWAVPTPQAWQSGTVKVWMLCIHRSATATGDVRIQADLAPKALNETMGSPGDAAATQNITDHTMAASAADQQDEIRMLDLGTVNMGASDRMLNVLIRRFGNDAADTFGASLYVFAIQLELQ